MGNESLMNDWAWAWNQQEQLVRLQKRLLKIHGVVKFNMHQHRFPSRNHENEIEFNNIFNHSSLASACFIHVLTWLDLVFLSSA